MGFLDAIGSTMANVTRNVGDVVQIHPQVSAGPGGQLQAHMQAGAPTHPWGPSPGASAPHPRQLGLNDLLFHSQLPQSHSPTLSQQPHFGEILGNLLTGDSTPTPKPQTPPDVSVPLLAAASSPPPPPKDPTLDPNTIQNPADFGKAVLQNLGAPSDPGMVNAFADWEKQEGGNWQNTNQFNPLNTGFQEPGAQGTSAGGMLSYPDWATGVKATADTIRQSNMAPIMSALQSGDASALGTAVAQTPWAGSHYTFNSTAPSGSQLSPSASHGNYPLNDPNSPQHQAVAYNAGNTNTGQAVSKAMTQIGLPYVYGGESPGQNFDCSGLTQWAFGQAGIQLPRVAQDQFNASTPVSSDQAKPGDLVFFGTPQDVHHVGIYLGNGQMLDAPHSGAQVRIESLQGWDTLGFGRPGGSQGNVPAYQGGPSSQGASGGGGGAGGSRQMPSRPGASVQSSRLASPTDKTTTSSIPFISSMAQTTAMDPIMASILGGGNAPSGLDNTTGPTDSSDPQKLLDQILGGT